MKKILIILILLTNIINANTIEIKNYCVKPEKVIAFSNQAEVELYKDIIENYRKCIKSFIENENKIIESHNLLLEEAIKDWNDFIKENQ